MTSKGSSPSSNVIRFAPGLSAGREVGASWKLVAQRKVKSYSPSLNFYAFDISFL